MSLSQKDVLGNILDAYQLIDPKKIRNEFKIYCCYLNRNGSEVIEKTASDLVMKDY